jgi:hypothetical protein
MSGKLYSSFQVTDCEGLLPDPFGFLSHPGQIWFTQLLEDSSEPLRVSVTSTYVRNEPEPVTGASTAWVYYSAYPGDQDETNNCAQVRRTTTPIGMNAP